MRASSVATQASREQRLAVADDVLANDSDLITLKVRVANLHQRYLDLSSQKAKVKC